VPRPRDKTRVELLADAVESLQHAAAALHEVDLRRCRTELRGQVKLTREMVDTARAQAGAALQLDAESLRR
jgi:hypothetical protein